LLLKPKDLLRLLDYIKSKKQTSPIDITYDCTGFLGPKYEGLVRNWFFYCTAGITTGSILHNGDIFVCPNVPRIPNLIQGNVRTNDYFDTWQNSFKPYRLKDRTSCDGCRQCINWTECRGGSFHLWDFEKQQPKFCHLQYINQNST
jgi:radical SAM protein with 4Fe4S-binding SPASM domain